MCRLEAPHLMRAFLLRPLVAEGRKHHSSKRVRVGAQRSLLKANHSPSKDTAVMPPINPNHPLMCSQALNLCV